MIDGRILTEKLLNYAKDNLQLSDYDLSVKRNLLYYLLKVEPLEVPYVNDDCSLTDTLNELTSYLIEKGISSADKTESFVSFILSNLLPLPSEVNKKFRALREKFGAHGACDYLYGLSLKGGAFKGDFSKNATLYLNSEEGDFYLYKSKEKPFIHSADFKGGVSNRVVLDLNGKEWNMRFVEPFISEKESIVTAYDGNRQVSLSDKVSAMLDFIEYLPEYSAQTIYFEENKSSQTGEFFRAGIKNGSLKRDCACTLSSVVYPDVEVSLSLFPQSVVRLQSFNRNTLENLSLEIIDKWLDYSDQLGGIYGRGGDGVSQNGIGVSVGYSKDNRYYTDILLVKASDYLSSGDLVKEFTVCDLEFFLFNKYLLSEDLAEVTSSAIPFLTKKTPLSEETLSLASSLQTYKEVIEKIIADYGFIRDAQKAEGIFKKEVVNFILTKFNKNSAFTNDDEGLRFCKKFLSLSDVR